MCRGELQAPNLLPWLEFDVVVLLFDVVEVKFVVALLVRVLFKGVANEVEIDKADEEAEHDEERLLSGLLLLPPPPPPPPPPTPPLLELQFNELIEGTFILI